MVESAVAVGGSKLEVREWPAEGALAPILLLHEGLGSVGLWREFPGQVGRATGRRVIAFSRYGHGRSGAPPRPRTPSFFHEEALQVVPDLLRELDITEKPVLVGHSDGASIALIHAAHHPIAAAVLLAPHVIVEQMTVDAIGQARREYEQGDLRIRMARHHDDPDAAFRGWCDVWLDPSFRAWSLEPEASELTAPTLLIQGDDDPYGSLAQLERIEQRAPGAVERYIVPGGHSPHLEHGDEVAARIAVFLARYC